MADATTVLSAELSANPQPLIEGFKRAEQATGAWATAAQRHMQSAQASFGDLKFDVVTTKAKAEQIKLIELQHQLDVARAAGETKTVAALTKEIDLLQTIRRLRSAGLNDNDATRGAHGAAEAVAAAREAAELREAAARRRERAVGNPAEAVASAFGRARLGVLEEGGAKLPLFGSSLEALGTAGLATAAALAAVAVAGEEAKKSLEFADDIDRTAKSLGITTTELQEFDHATAGTSVGIAKGREALAAFNETFGKYSSGLASAKQGKFFQALGITPESARDLGSTQEALEKTLGALAKIQNPQQRAALATQLGLKDFLVVLAEGQEGVEKFVQSMKSAQGAGAVIGPEEIRRAAELNDKLEQVEHTVSVELKKAFIELGPAVLAVAELIERAAKGIAGMATGITNVSAGLSSFQGRGLQHLDDATGSVLRQAIGFAYNHSQVGQSLNSGGAALGALAQQGAAVRLRQSATEALSGRFDFSAYGLGQRPKGVDLSLPGKEKKAPEDQTANYDKAAVDAYQSAQKALNTAIAALTGDIEARGEIEKQAVAADLTKKLADLEAEEVKIRASKVDAHRRDQLLQLELAKSSEKIAALARQELIDRQTAAALREQELQQAREDAAFVDRTRTARAAIRPDAQGRANASLQNFADQQDLEDQAQQNDLANRVADKKLSQEAADQKLAAGRTARSAERVAQRDSSLRGSDPLYGLARPLTSVNDDLRGVEADGVKSLGDGLAAVVSGTKDVKAAFADMAQAIIADLIKIAVQRSIEQPLANLLLGASGGNINAAGGSVFASLLRGGSAGGAEDGFLDSVIASLPAFANGGQVGGSGGPTSDNILARLSPGEFVVSNAMMKGLSGMGVPQRSGGGVTLNLSVDAGGAFSFEHVADAVEGGVHRAVAASGLQLASVTRRQANAQRYDLSRT